MIDSLKILQERKATLKQEIIAKEKELHNVWDDLFHKPEPLAQSFSPTRRVMSFLSSSTAVIDGILLGWKLYNRFGRRRRR